MKNYFIAGASSGIGQTLAQQLATTAKVYGTYCNNKPDNVITNISYHQLDVLSDDYALDFLPERLDGFVYCPGAVNLKSLAFIKPDDFVADYRLQVLGAVRIIQLILERLKRAPQASILFFSSVAAQTGFPFHSIVSSSKGAIEGLTKALAAELAPNVRVNAIAPSLTQTPLTAKLLNTDSKIEYNAQRHPLKKLGTAEEIAALAAFLLSDQASWISGQIIHQDGGLSAVRV